MTEHPSILISGGGIGGLTLSLALADRGYICHILEARGEFSELGAGIQLGPNATRILTKLNLLENLKIRAFMPKEVEIKNGQSGEQLASLPLIPNMEERFFGPYLAMRRVDLQSVLLEHVFAHERISVTTGFKLVDARSTDTHVTAISDSGEEIRGTALLGSDGIWSRLREIISPQSTLRFSGRTAWRALLPLNQLPPEISKESVGLWLGPNAHLVHYPVGQGEGEENQLNVVAFIDDPAEESRWSQPADQAELMPHFQSWSETPRRLINMIRDWRKWSLYDAAPLPIWHQGRICLLGDAAHPVLPFLAQGGALAIEDAYILAESIADNDDDIEIAFKIFEARRNPRTTRVQSASRRNGRIYHLRRPTSLARDLVLKNTSPERLMRRYDWLYGYDVKTESGL